MKHETIAVEAASITADTNLLHSAKASLARFITLAIIGCFIVVGGIAAAVGYAATGSSPSAVVAIVAAGAMAAVVIAVLCGQLIARAIARVMVYPINLLVSQFDDDSDSDYRWQSGRALGGADIRRDLDLLKRRTRQATGRSRKMIADLDKARDEASRQNLAKSQFLANMSHELRTPLNAILGYAMLLYEDAAEAKDASSMADLDRIQQAGRNLLSIINDILDLAKIETGRTTVQRGVIDLSMLVSTLADSYQTSAARNGNSFTHSVATEAEIMIGDQPKVTQCLTNLLSNAFKFTHKGTVDLTVSAIDYAGRNWIQFEVRDSGIGIDQAHIDTLFEAFQQADGSATRQHGGTGLGLALVRKLAQMMGGSCTVESTVGKGSTFRLTLPAGEPGEGVSLRIDPAAAVTSDYDEIPSAEHTALVIDDDESALDLLRRWLARMGYNVLSTTDGEVGLQLARTHLPDLILMDAMLPGRSGYDLTDELRHDAATAKIPTILITVDDDRQRGLRSGATDYLRKPISEVQLREVLDVYRGRMVGEVLVIEDDDDAADLVARCVAQVGFSSRRALDGVEGLMMASEKRPDAIVLDLAMPSMNGFEVLDRLSADDALRDVPLIVVSGADISLEEHRRLARAGHRFLPKAASTPRQIAQSLKELVA